ncbi:hypothetical protein E4U53_002015 [Claviceps sorghi]|nr:hypothetical protein E4U53_002015 [Claviceps sorghi]
MATTTRTQKPIVPSAHPDLDYASGTGGDDPYGSGGTGPTSGQDEYGSGRTQGGDDTSARPPADDAHRPTHDDRRGSTTGKVFEKVGHVLGSDTLADKGREKQGRGE